MHEKQTNSSSKREGNDRQPTSNESSSDTEKTSGSLFKTSGAGIELSRIKELPTSFYNGYASLDEFLSTASTSDNTNGNGNGNGGGSNKAPHLKRHHNRVFHGEKKVSIIQTGSGVKVESGPGNGGTKKSSGFKNAPQSSTITAAKTKSANVPKGDEHQGYAQDVIDEMNRQYDHNLCLDRFINDIEQRQQKQKQATQASAEQEQIKVDRASNISPSNSSLSSSCSSAMPQSNEDTDSGSRNSESIKSSTGKEKDESSGNNSSNSSNSSNNEKPKKEKKEKKEKSTKTTKSIPIPTMTLDDSAQSSSSKQFSCSIESGIEVTSSSPADEIAENSPANSIIGEKTKNYKGGKLGRKRKRGYIYNPKPVIEKPPKQFVPEQAKDQSYWDKRQRNNEAARRSREMRRLKEKETCDKLLQLKKENEALRVAITLLIQRNENLECVIDEFEKNESNARNEPVTVPVTC